MSSTEPESTQNEPDFQPRNSRIAGLLTALSPGLGLMYVGRPWRGLAANFLFVVALAGFVGLFVWLEFFPLLPLLILVTGWIVVTALIASDVRRLADDHGESYEARGYNHWTIYATTTLVTWLLPIAAILGLSMRHVWGMTSVDDRAMYPTVRAGETVFVDKSAYETTPPKPGDLVALRFPGEEASRLLRVIAAGGDRIELSAGTIYVNDRRLSRQPFDARLVSRRRSDSPEYELWVEKNRHTNYVVSMRPSHRGAPEFESKSLEADKLYLMADNRSHSKGGGSDSSSPGDSRQFGPVRRGAIAGRPLYIAWSQAPSDGEIRWNRIGLKLR